jgi:type II secretory pathway component PulF
MAAQLIGGAGGIVVAVSKYYGSRPALVRARLARALATSIEAGMPLERALRLSANASGSDEVRRHVGRDGEREMSMRSIVMTLAGCPHLTPDFLAVVDTAECTGNFAALTRLAELYEDGFR